MKPTKDELIRARDQAWNDAAEARVKLAEELAKQQPDEDTKKSLEQKIEDANRTAKDLSNQITRPPRSDC